MDMRKLLAEVVGTFVFFSFGLIAVLSNLAFSSGADLLVIAFGFGVGLFVAIQVAGAISGGHFNPAVTIAAVLDGRLDWMNGLGYVVGAARRRLRCRAARPRHVEPGGRRADHHEARPWHQ